jgi:hypothetical protein
MSAIPAHPIAKSFSAASIPLLGFFLDETALRTNWDVK